MADASPGGAVMMTEVAGRATEDLVPLIWAWATPGAHVDTDGLRSYRLVGDLGFQHGVVEHVRHFVNPGDDAHTQRIESMWRQLRDWLRKHHYSCGDRRDAYVKEFCFRYNRGRDPQVIWRSLFPS